MRGYPSSSHSRTGPKLHENECTLSLPSKKREKKKKKERAKVTSLKSFTLLRFFYERKKKVC